jgi:hypothetical protein
MFKQALIYKEIFSLLLNLADGGNGLVFTNHGDTAATILYYIVVPLLSNRHLSG